MDLKALKNDIIRIFKDNPNILTTDYEPLADEIVKVVKRRVTPEKKRKLVVPTLLEETEIAE